MGRMGKEREGAKSRQEGAPEEGPRAPEGVPVMLAHGGTLCPLELLALPALVAYAWGVVRCLSTALRLRGKGPIR